MEKLIGWLRLGTRLTFFVLYLLCGMLLGVIHRLIDLATRRSHSRLPTSNAYLILFCRLIGFRVHLVGQRPESACMVVSNHVSWVDIPVIGSILPVHFLSKAEVRQWPLIGWLAQEAGTLFIKRGSGQSGRVAEQLAGTLEGLAPRRHVLVFPEGTTGTGERTLTFHGKMFQAAIAAGTPVQPVTLCYKRDGQRDLTIPFVGDDDFVQHLLRLFKAPRIDAYVILHSPITPVAGSDAGRLAKQAQEQVEAGLRMLLPGPLLSSKPLAHGIVANGSLTESLDHKTGPFDCNPLPKGSSKTLVSKNLV